MFNKIFLSYERIQHQDDKPFAERFGQNDDGQEFDFGSFYRLDFGIARHGAFAVDGYRLARQQSHGSQPVFEEIGLTSEDVRGAEFSVPRFVSMSCGRGRFRLPNAVRPKRQQPKTRAESESFGSYLSVNMPLAGNSAVRKRHFAVILVYLRGF